MAKLFKTAFAYQGTTEQLPDAAQPDGKASYAEGFTDEYTLDYGDADARDISQSELNGIFHDITEAIGELQKYGVAVWQSDMTPIAKYSLVFHDDKLWQAKKNTSATPAAGADWQQVDIADIVSQLGTLDLNDYATKTYVNSAVNGLASTSYVDSAVASKATASVVNAQLAGKFDKTDVAQESGQSTTKVMSQKAVTDALSDAASGQLSWGAITGDIENQDDLQDALALKIDKEEGKALSTNDYSDADKAKLTSLEGSHYRGVYINEAALSEISDPVAGDYADVDAGAGSDAERWIYDASDAKWVAQESATSVTASQVKQLYESNADTNEFTDDDKSKLSSLPTNQTLTGMLDNKVDKETGKGLIDPAPVDGKEYARKDGTWVEVVGGGGGASALAELTDVDFGTPTDGQVLTYDAATQKSKFTDQAGGGGGDVEEAPLDGKLYGRKAAGWTEVVVESGMLGLNFDQEALRLNGRDFPLFSDFPDSTKNYKGAIANAVEDTSFPYTATYIGDYGGVGDSITVEVFPDRNQFFRFSYTTIVFEGQDAMIPVSATPFYSVYTTDGLPSGVTSLEIYYQLTNHRIFEIAGISAGIAAGNAGVPLSIDLSTLTSSETIVYGMPIDKHPLPLTLDFGDPLGTGVEGFGVNGIGHDGVKYEAWMGSNGSLVLVSDNNLEHSLLVSIPENR